MDTENVIIDSYEYKCIKEKAKKILEELGDCYIEDLRDKDKYTCCFKGFGLKIKSSFYDTKDKNYDKNYIKSKINDISIDFNYNKRVYNTTTSYFKKGNWEDIFDNLYNKLNEIRKIIEKRNYIIEHIRNGIDNNLIEELRNNNIFIYKNDESTCEKYLNKDYIISKDGINVFWISSDSDYQKTIIFEYDSWLDTIYDSIKKREDKDNKEIEYKNDIITKTYIKQLKSLK